MEWLLSHYFLLSVCSTFLMFFLNCLIKILVFISFFLCYSSWNFWNNFRLTKYFKNSTLPFFLKTLLVLDLYTHFKATSLYSMPSWLIRLSFWNYLSSTWGTSLSARVFLGIKFYVWFIWGSPSSVFIFDK